MKTSTKLILIFSGLFVAGILSLYITSSVFRDKKRFSQDVDYRQETGRLPDFSVVVVQDSAACILITSDSNSLLWFQPRDSMQKSLKVYVRNDTLFVAQTPSDIAYRVRIMAKNVTTVLVKRGASVRLLKIIQDKLYVQVESGSCYLESIPNEEQINLQQKTLHLTVNASAKSYIEFNSWCDFLTVNVDSSRLQINTSSDPNSYIRSVALTAHHGSTVILYKCPSQFTMQKDSTSTFRVY